MLWELKDLERRREEIEAEANALRRDVKLSAKKRRARLEALNREDTQIYSRRQRVLSLIAGDPQLSKMRDHEYAKTVIPPLPETQRGLPETHGQLTPAQAKRIELQTYILARQQASVFERAVENARYLEQEREPGD
jgi:hypothetical protein